MGKLKSFNNVIIILALLISMLISVTAINWNDNSEYILFLNGTKPYNDTAFWGESGKVGGDTKNIDYLRLLLNADPGTTEGYLIANGTTDSSNLPVRIHESGDNSTIYLRTELTSLECSGGNEICFIRFGITDGSNSVYYYSNDTDFNPQPPDYTMNTNLTIGIFPSLDTLNFSIDDGTETEIDISSLSNTNEWYYKIWMNESDANADVIIHNIKAFYNDYFVILDTPLNNSQGVQSPTIFNSTLIGLGNINITSAEIYIWDSNGNIYNQTTNILTGKLNQTSWAIDLIPGRYTWNVLGSFTNGTDTATTFASSNRTLTYGLEINNISYDSIVSEGSIQDFILNLSVSDSAQLTQGTFYYNGTGTSSSIDVDGNERILTISDFEVPSVSSETNITFYWELLFDNGFSFNTTELTQSIVTISLDDCSVYTNQLFNISLFDEREQTSLNGTIELLYRVLNKPSYNEIDTFSGKFEGVNGTLVCSENNLFDSNLAYSAEIKYYSTNHSSEQYNVQIADLVSSVAPLNLYDLEDEHSTEFKIEYKDNSFTLVEGAIVQLQRQYLEDGDYKIVEAPLTSNEGTAVVHIDLDANKYRATIVKNGEVLDEYENLVFVCDSPLTGDCTQDLVGSVDPRNSPTLTELLDFVYSEPVLLNETITISFSIPSGAPAIVGILLEHKDMFGNSTLCNQTITSSAGSISCGYTPTIGDSFLDLTLTKNGDIILQKSYIIPEEGAFDFLGNNFFIVIILVLSVVGMAFSSPEWIVINGVVVFVIAGGLWLLNGLGFVVGLGGLAWILVAAGILIFKMAKQEDK